MSGKHGVFVWNELWSRDAEKAKAFYGKLLGWTYRRMPDDGSGGHYDLALKDGAEVGGVFQMAGEVFRDMSEQWVAYVQVDDLDKTIREAESHGAKACCPVQAIPGVGRFIVLRDPHGVLLGWMTPEQP